MWKAYGGEPNLDLLQAFLNLGPAEMDFRSFIVVGIDGEFHFELEGGFADGAGNSPSNRWRFLGMIHPWEAARLCKSSIIMGKRKQATDVDSDPDIHDKFYTFSASFVLSMCGSKLIFVFLEFPFAKELKDSADCHFVVAHVTPPSWKQYLRDISLEKLCDIHDKAYMRQAVLGNMLNSQTRQLMSALKKARASYDAIQEREIEKDKAYAELERICNEALQDLDMNASAKDVWDKNSSCDGDIRVQMIPGL
ncbi:hypothetical protein Tco_0016476 [Tanacetum coccineum]